MPTAQMSAREQFWTAKSFAVVGNTSKRKFPKVTYNALKQAGKTVWPIDPSTGTIENDKAYPDFTYLPSVPEAVVLELPKDQTASWVKKAAEAGIKKVWIHQMTDTPEALAVAKEHSMEVCAGTCAVMYNVPGLSGHAVHRWIQKLRKAY
jgi:predicted CoA-binding protein